VGVDDQPSLLPGRTECHEKPFPERHPCAEHDSDVAHWAVRRRGPVGAVAPSIVEDPVVGGGGPALDAGRDDQAKSFIGFLIAESGRRGPERRIRKEDPIRTRSDISQCTHPGRISRSRHRGSGHSYDPVPPAPGRPGSRIPSDGKEFTGNPPDFERPKPRR